MAFPTPTFSEVEAQYGPTEIPQSAADDLIDAAKRTADDIYSSTIVFTAEVEGNEKDFVILVACHKWALREGEPQSESQAGGSVSWNTVTGEWQTHLSQTKWGREALGYLRGRPNISLFST